VCIGVVFATCYGMLGMTAFPMVVIGVIDLLIWCCWVSHDIVIILWYQCSEYGNF